MEGVRKQHTTRDIITALLPLLGVAEARALTHTQKTAPDAANIEDGRPEGQI